MRLDGIRVDRLRRRTQRRYRASEPRIGSFAKAKSRIDADRLTTRLTAEQIIANGPRLGDLGAHGPPSLLARRVAVADFEHHFATGIEPLVNILLDPCSPF